MMMMQPVKSFAEEQRDLECDDDFMGMRPWRNDGHRNHVGQVWARKVQRDKETAAASNPEQARFAQEEAPRPLTFQAVGLSQLPYWATSLKARGCKDGAKTPRHGASDYLRSCACVESNTSRIESSRA